MKRNEHTFRRFYFEFPVAKLCKTSSRSYEYIEAEKIKLMTHFSYIRTEVNYLILAIGKKGARRLYGFTRYKVKIIGSESPDPKYFFFLGKYNLIRPY